MMQKTNEPNQAKAKQIYPQNKHIESATDKRVKHWRFSQFSLRQTTGAKAILGSLKYPIHIVIIMNLSGGYCFQQREIWHEVIV